MENKIFVQNENQPDPRLTDLREVFGEGFTQLVDRIRRDNPELSSDEVLGYAWSLIPEATAYMQPAEPEYLLEVAITIYEGYETYRRNNR